MRKLTLEAVKFELTMPAPKNNYTYFEAPNGWNILNDKFWFSINLSMNKCKARKEVVEPVKDEVINRPVTPSWYQNPTIIILGVPVVFAVGLVVGVIVTK